MLAEAAHLSFYAGDAREMLRTAERADELSRGLEGRAPILAGLALGMALILAGEGECRRCARSALPSQRWRRRTSCATTRTSPCWAAHGPLWLREAEAGRGLYERALEVVRSRTALGRAPRAPLPRRPRLGDDRSPGPAPQSSVRRGDHARARDRAETSMLAFALAGLAALEARQGREAECRAHAAEAREACVRAGMGVQELWALTALGDLELGLGRPDAALAHYSECEELRTRAGSRTPTSRRCPS